MPAARADVRGLESAVGAVSLFSALRPDEVARVARRFELRALGSGETLSFDARVDAQRLVVVINGRAQLAVESRGRTLHSVLGPGDRHGEVALLSGLARKVTLTAASPTQVALLDRAGLDALVAELPVVALALAAELSREVSFANDLVRQLRELWAENLSGDQLTAALAGRRDVLEARGARVRRLSVGALFRRAVVDRGQEPPFWATVGFLAALAGARAVVALILKYGLEKQLFALVPGTDPNPMHVHHFNYGLLLIAAAGLAALFPLGRRALRLLAFAFGLGAGLVFDEFALFWNLNPEYAQSLSLYSAGVVLVLLVNLTWFREFWVLVVRRVLFTLRALR